VNEFLHLFWGNKSLVYTERGARYRTGFCEGAHPPPGVPLSRLETTKEGSSDSEFREAKKAPRNQNPPSSVIAHSGPIRGRAPAEFAGSFPFRASHSGEERFVRSLPHPQGPTQGIPGGCAYGRLTPGHGGLEFSHAGGVSRLDFGDRRRGFAKAPPQGGAATPASGNKKRTADSNSREAEKNHVTIAPDPLSGHHAGSPHFGRALL
jgi:hypothetical protein